ncbi:hypothetical protein Dda_1401 [Drechslerella dactyloides]|uniref:F-box domain-containing protein n=1 Tax=Drechslerella dactyloides TaxID=74499 RepID=A0AAD6J1N7_DREDA|nr:hypothetical protein Dda_1401 [Drechslerella dactyloides]
MPRSTLGHRTMALADAIDAFAKAQTNDREKFLREVFKLFEPSERNIVRQLLQDANFHFDILVNLPGELRLMIYDYLPPRDLFSNRQVSRRWRDVLSSEQLAHKMTCMNYSMCTDFSEYNGYLKTDPLRALRNLAFREYATREGLVRLRKKIDVNRLPSSRPNRRRDWAVKGYPPSLNYVVVREVSTDSPSSFSDVKLLLVPLVGSSGRADIELLNPQREQLWEKPFHPGEYFVAAVTQLSRLMQFENVAIGSSKNYVIVRSGNGNDNPNYIFFDMTTRESRVVEHYDESITDSQLVLTFKKANESDRHRRQSVPVTIEILEDSKQVVVGHTLNRSFLLCRYNFAECFAGGEMVYVDKCELPIQHIPTDLQHHRVRFRRTKNAFMLQERRSPTDVCTHAYVDLKGRRPSVTQRFLDLKDKELFGRHDCPMPGDRRRAFCYGDTVYVANVINDNTGDGVVLWRSRGVRVRDGLDLAPEKQVLEDTKQLGRDFQTVAIADAGFLLSFKTGLIMYEWLDYDSVEEQRAAEEASQ